MNIAKRMKVLIKLFQKFAGDWGQRPQGLNRRSREEKARAVVIPVSYTHLDVYKRQDLNYLFRP